MIFLLFYNFNENKWFHKEIFPSTVFMILTMIQTMISKDSIKSTCFTPHDRRHIIHTMMKFVIVFEIADNLTENKFIFNRNPETS